MPPDIIMYIITPALHISDANEAWLHRKTSGDMNSSVPHIFIGIFFLMPRFLANPKSINFKASEDWLFFELSIRSLTKRIFSGFRSRWIILLLCINSIASRICLAKIWHFASVSLYFVDEMYLKSSPPGKYSVRVIDRLSST